MREFEVLWMEEKQRERRIRTVTEIVVKTWKGNGKKMRTMQRSRREREGVFGIEKNTELEGQKKEGRKQVEMNDACSEKLLVQLMRAGYLEEQMVTMEVVGVPNCKLHYTSDNIVFFYST